jgi:glycosyltransferase involved in cell wall biosynthesis
MSTTTLVGPRVKPRPQAYAARPAAVPAVLHVDGGHGWAGGQNQVRLLIRELQVIGLRQLCICPKGSPLEQRLLLEGLPVLGINWRGGSDPRAMFAIGRKLRHFHVVHCHDAHALQAGIAPAKALATPVVATRRVCFDTNSFKWNLPDRVIAISEAVRDTLLAAGVKKERICLIHSGIDVQEVRALSPAVPTLRTRLGVDSQCFVAANIGSLVGYKNQVLITEAARHTNDVRWAVVGEGRERSAIENAITARGVGNAVTLTGNIPDARRILREINAFAFTSVGEALGTSVLDAMAAGVPVVAADSAGPAEVLKPVHDETGCSLYTPNDAAALARMIQRVHDSADTRDAMIIAQNRRIEDFRSERTAMLTLDVYREILR